MNFVLGLVLRSVRTNERDHMVTFLSIEQGLMTGFAKNSVNSKRFGSSFDLFTGSNFALHQKEDCLPFIQEAHPEFYFSKLNNSFEQLSAASVIGEVLLKLEYTPALSGQCFILATHTLTALESIKSNQIWIVLNIFFTNLFRYLGVNPHYSTQCYYCQKALTQGYWSISEAILMCPPCAQQFSMQSYSFLSIEQLDILKNLQQVPLHSFPIEEFCPQQAEKIFRILELLLYYHVPGFQKRPLSAVKFLYTHL